MAPPQNKTPHSSISWVTNNGNILSGADSVNPQIDAAGDYTLIISNQDNDCVDSASVVVTEDFEVPDIQITVPDTLNCNVPEIQLESISTLDPLLSVFSWSSSDGNIESDSDSSKPLVNAPGTYEVLLENNQNGCHITASIDVFQDIQIPVIQLAQPAILNCGLTSTQLSALGSDIGLTFTLEWTAVTGNILNGEDGPSPEIDQPGIYQLQITNTTNGCFIKDEVEVLQDIVTPTVNIAQPNVLDCNTTQIDLDASNSSNGPDFDFSWTTTNGNITNGATGFKSFNRSTGRIYAYDPE